MFFGTVDDLLEGAEIYQKDSEKAGNSCKLITYEEQGHGFFNHAAKGGKYYDLTLAEMDRLIICLRMNDAPGVLMSCENLDCQTKPEL